MPENFINISQANKKNNVVVYEIMHKERIVATISTIGCAMVYDEKFMPYDLYFDMEEDIDTLFNNLNNFYHWLNTYSNLEHFGALFSYILILGYTALEGSPNFYFKM